MELVADIHLILLVAFTDNIKAKGPLLIFTASSIIYFFIISIYSILALFHNGKLGLSICLGKKNCVLFKLWKMKENMGKLRRWEMMKEGNQCGEQTWLFINKPSTLDDLIHQPNTLPFLFTGRVVFPKKITICHKLSILVMTWSNISIIYTICNNNHK